VRVAQLTHDEEAESPDGDERERHDGGRREPIVTLALFEHELQRCDARRHRA